MNPTNNNRSRLSLIIQREYMSIVGRKSFIVMTILIPLISVACFALPGLLMLMNTSDEQTVAVVDETHRLYSALTDDDGYKFQDITSVGAANVHDFFTNTDNVYAVLVIPANVDSIPRVNIYSNNAVKASLSSHVEECLRTALSDERVQSYGVANLKEMIDNCRVNVTVDSVKWAEDGSEERSSATFASILGMVLSLLTYMFVLMYGAMIMGSVVEEKTSRIIEVIVSSCRPIELMLGKIIGVGLVGITQIAIWAVFLGIGSSVLGIAIGGMAGIDTAAAAEASGDMVAAINAFAGDGELGEIIEIILSVNYVQILTCFVLYFLGGFLLYSSLFAAFGSAADQPSDASQFTTPIMMIMVFALWAGIACAETPDGNLAFWCSMIPFTSPVVMMVRLPYDVPVWEIALSVALLYASALGITVLAARIYRTGILMYGKKVSIKDIIKWIK
ncbi:MAG: ABC transporter permease [Muribaculaceae bacterium]